MDAVSSVTPLYYKYSIDEIKNYYRVLAETAELPMIIYNIPTLTGTTLSTEQIHELLEIPGVDGMKFTSSDFFGLQRLCSDYPDKVFFNGSDEMFLSGLTAGAIGGIGTTYNFMPELFVEIYKQFRLSDIKAAQKIQDIANRVIEKVTHLSECLMITE